MASTHFHLQDPPHHSTPTWRRAPHPSTPTAHSATPLLPRLLIRLSDTEVRDLVYDTVLATITRHQTSGKTQLELRRADASLLGSLGFPSSSEIDVTVNGRAIKLKHGGFVHDRWKFEPASGGEKWCWRMSDDQNGELRDRADGGEEVARLEDGSLVVERMGLSAAELDEVVATAVAIVEKARRRKQEEEANVVLLTTVAAAGYT
jgi:hypothetical protein